MPFHIIAFVNQSLRYVQLPSYTESSAATSGTESSAGDATESGTESSAATSVEVEDESSVRCFHHFEKNCEGLPKFWRLNR